LKPSKNLKIVFAFFLGIGLPSLLLGYLAWRGIRNDRALTEKDRLNRCETMAVRVQQRVDDQCRILAELLDGRVSRDAVLDPFLTGELRSEHPLIEAVFTLDSGGRIRFPGERLLYNTWGHSPEPDPMSLDGSASLLQEGEAYEFIHKQYERAEDCYRRAAGEAGAAEIKARILCALSRVQRKNGQDRDALNTCRELVSRFGEISLLDGLPARAVAALEMGSIYCRIGEFQKSFDSLARLYGVILSGEMNLRKPALDWLLQEVGIRIRGTASRAGRQGSAYLDSLSQWKIREVLERERCSKLLAFHERAEFYFMHGRQEFGNAADGGWKKIVIEAPGVHPEICLLMSSPDPVFPRWGILLNTGYLKTVFLPSLLNQYAGSESIGWIVRDESGDPLVMKQETLTAGLVMQTSFHDRFPPWILEFHEEDPSLLKALFFSRRSIYVYIFFLIGFVLIFGLSLTYRTVHQEMELTRIKTDFVTAVSHDFKNPLTSIRQLSEMLKAGRVPTEEKRRQYYHAIVEQSDRLKFMVSNIVDYARMEKGTRALNFEMINPGPLVRRVAAEARNRFLNTDFTIQAKISTRLPFIRGDAAALQQALNNLIDNAVKFSDDKQRVDVKAVWRNGEIVISVQDWGIGIDAGDQEKIFRDFYRVKSPGTRKIKGSGLGLTLVRQIAHAHHGRIQVQSEPGKGSTFTLILPCDKKSPMKEKG